MSDDEFWLIEELHKTAINCHDKEEAIRNRLSELRLRASEQRSLSARSRHATGDDKMTENRIRSVQQSLDRIVAEKISMNEIGALLTMCFDELAGKSLRTAGFEALHERFNELDVAEKQLVHTALISETRRWQPELRVALGNLIARNRANC